MNDALIRLERPADGAALAQLVETAFAEKSYSDGTEASIVPRLRENDALTLSLVAEMAGRIVGQVAFSPVRIGNIDQGWTGLGPLSVLPEFQQQGLGQALVRAGLSSMEKAGAGGCVLVGDPNYYTRFGFRSGPPITVPWVEEPYMQWLPFGEILPEGEVEFHRVFHPESKN